MLKIQNSQIPKLKYIEELYQKLILFWIILWMSTILDNSYYIKISTLQVVQFALYDIRYTWDPFFQYVFLSFLLFQHTDIPLSLYKKYDIRCIYFGFHRSNIPLIIPGSNQENLGRIRYWPKSTLFLQNRVPKI